MRFRVVCGFDVTMAIFCPTSRFTKVDFPAFGRPTIATNPDLCAAPVFTFSTSFTFSPTLTAGSHASQCPTIFVFSLAILSAGSLPALQNEILPDRISRPARELSHSHGLAVRQWLLPSHPPILQSAHPASLPHRLSPYCPA